MTQRIQLFPESTDVSPISGKKRGFDPEETVEVWQRYRTPMKQEEKEKLVCIRGTGCTACTRNPTAVKKREWNAANRKAREAAAAVGLVAKEPKPFVPPKPAPIASMQVYPQSDPNNHEVLFVLLSHLTFGASSNWLAYTIRQCGWTGYIAMDLAVRCGHGKPTDAQVEACTPYLRHNLKLTQATRILVCGTPASKSVTGNTMHPWNHGSWTHLKSIDLGDGEQRGRTLVVSAPDPADAQRNRFIGALMKDAVAKACFDPIPADLNRKVHALVVETKEELKEFLEWTRQIPWASYDVEWVGVPYNDDFRMVSCSFSHPDWDTVYQFHHALKAKLVKRVISEVLERVPIAAQNIAAELEASQCFFGVEIAEVYFDTLPAYKLLNVDSKAALQDLAYYIGHNSHKSEMADAMEAVRAVAESRVPPDVGGASYKAYIQDIVDPEVGLRYNALDTYVTGELVVEAEKQLTAPNVSFLRKTYDTFTIPALKLVHRIHNTGMCIDRRALTHTRRILNENLVAVEAELERKGMPDPGSVQQVRSYLEENGLFDKLFEHLQYDHNNRKVDAKTYERKLSKYQSAKTKTMSTGRHTLKLMADWDEAGVVKGLLEYREKSKLLVAYGDTLSSYIRDDGRVHAYYRLDGAATGRLCVDGDTLIHTDTGRHAIKDFPALARAGTILVRSHLDRWCRVQAVIVKGVEAMYRVRTSDGGDLTCTGGHRVLTPAGWRHVRDLHCKDVVSTPAVTTEMMHRPGGHATIMSIVPVGDRLVWDITVEGDHSYTAGGFINHNSSHSPSAHQVPKHGPNASLIKSVYCAPLGWVLVAFDYKTLEVFIAAIISQDEAMMEACRGADFHLETAKKMAPYAWGCTAAEVELEVLSGNKSKRSAAKGITFSILYGAGAFALADTLKCSLEVAEELIKAYYAAYPAFARWVKSQHAFAKAHGFVHVPWVDGPSRIRPLTAAGFLSRDDIGRMNGALRRAVNTPVQGMAAQYGVLASIDLDNQFRREKMPAEVNAMVHDSIMVACHPSVVDEVVPRMFHAMTSLATGVDIRLQVDAEIGETWGTLEPIDLVPYVGVSA